MNAKAFPIWCLRAWTVQLNNIGHNSQIFTQVHSSVAALCLRWNSEPSATFGEADEFRGYIASVRWKRMDQSGWIPVNASHTSAEYLWNIWVNINMNYLSTKATSISPNPSTTSEALPSKLPALSLSNHFVNQNVSTSIWKTKVTVRFHWVFACPFGLGHFFGHRLPPIQVTANQKPLISHSP